MELKYLGKIASDEDVSPEEVIKVIKKWEKICGECWYCYKDLTEEVIVNCCNQYNPSENIKNELGIILAIEENFKDHIVITLLEIFEESQNYDPSLIKWVLCAPIKDIELIKFIEKEVLTKYPEEKSLKKYLFQDTKQNKEVVKLSRN